MNGMATQLNLRADRPGTFGGLSAHFSGDGFPDMHFDVHVVPPVQFSEWTYEASRAEKSLDEASYTEIAKPSTKNQPATYRLADPHLFHAIVTQKLPPSPGAQAGVKGADLPAGGANAR
jgi:cytochrome o ubiquinol oxidase subunit 2